MPIRTYWNWPPQHSYSIDSDRALHRLSRCRLHRYPCDPCPAPRSSALRVVCRPSPYALQSTPYRASCIQEKKNFVRWAKTADFLGPVFVTPLKDVERPAQPVMDLDPANIVEDDFSFWDRQLFNEDQTQPILADNLFVHSSCITGDAPLPSDLTAEPVAFVWGTPDKLRGNCSLGGFSCKTIEEGQYKGYCASCIAPQCRRRFGIAPDGHGPQDIAVTSKPWSTIDKHPKLAPDDVPPTSLLSASFSQGSQQHPSMPSSAEIGPPAEISDKNSSPRKISTRFSREAVKILKRWLYSHSRKPYPSEEEKVILQDQTGLNKTQISNWLANARRRGNIKPTRSTIPHVPNSWTDPIDIPRRPDTPAFGSDARNLNPLERWVDSPPENEPASVSAIAQAVALNSYIPSGLNSPYSFAFTDDGSNRSFCNASSASSAGTSSSGSFASAYLHGSVGSFGSMSQLHGGRRRRRAGFKRPEKTSSATSLKKFQCTFCTETFKTKHDWQRHEKSLHLSLERWMCAPDGPQVLNPQTNQICCIFCGEVEPNDTHIESHNHSACQERSPEERTFYRKDHLNQHLRLVHNAKFLDWSMKSWKTASPKIQSRCGFCGIAMDCWSMRVDHLAQHFKTGTTMADWKGDWGFDAPVLDMLENFIPPYLIENERLSPFPYVASGAPVYTPRCAYELIKLELDYFIVNYEEKMGTMPCDDELQLEACRIVFASEVLSLQGISAKFSWLRDLLMVSEDITCKAQFAPIRQGTENRLSILKIDGEDNLFELCPLEHQLREFVREKTFLGLTNMDDELQQEACCIIRRIEDATTTPSHLIANWLVRLITSSTSWLANFRQRANLPRTDGMDFNCRSMDPNLINSHAHNYDRIEQSLGHDINAQRSKGVDPLDDNLQRQSRIMYEVGDGGNQMAADNIEWLDAFKQRHTRNSNEAYTSFTSIKLRPAIYQAQRQQLNAVARTQHARPVAGGCSEVTPVAVAAFLNRPSGQAGKQGAFFLTDANCYRRLARELTRFVSSTMSPNNPNHHVPTDAEIQHQARWILFDDDDPWNQTVADNAEWLMRFKRDAGILPPGPGLSLNTISWNISQGGTGFAPPYAFPGKRMLHAASATPNFTNTTGDTKAPPATTASTGFTNLVTTNSSAPGSDKIEIFVHDNVKPFETDQAALDTYVKTFASRYTRPASIFCSRELETGLIGYVKADIERGAGFPSDEALKLRGRQILDSEETAADDPCLLERFKVWVTALLGQPQEQQLLPVPSALSCHINTNLTDAEVDSILANMSFDTMAETALSTSRRIA